MDKQEIDMHLAAGRYYGRNSTCGKKIKHPDEESAVKHAENLNKSKNAKNAVEAYPCYFCSERFPDSTPDDFTHLYWHVGRKMTAEERELFSQSSTWLLEAENVVLSASGPVFGEQLGEVTLRVHSRKLCEGRFCCIHNPSQHHMVTWPMNWRSDRGIMERLCIHGIGHIDPDDADYRKSRDGDNYDSGVHGCDGCCVKPKEEND